MGRCLSWDGARLFSEQQRISFKPLKLLMRRVPNKPLGLSLGKQPGTVQLGLLKFVLQGECPVMQYRITILA